MLTVRCIAVATYVNNNTGFKIFDSHARDLYGRGQPQHVYMCSSRSIVP